jgi:hypothetical protein
MTLKHAGAPALVCARRSAARGRALYAKRRSLQRRVRRRHQIQRCLTSFLFICPFFAPGHGCSKRRAYVDQRHYDHAASDQAAQCASAALQIIASHQGLGRRGKRARALAHQKQCLKGSRARVESSRLTTKLSDGEMSSQHAGAPASRCAQGQVARGRALYAKRRSLQRRVRRPGGYLEVKGFIASPLVAVGESALNHPLSPAVARWLVWASSKFRNLVAIGHPSRWFHGPPIEHSCIRLRCTRDHFAHLPN